MPGMSGFLALLPVAMMTGVGTEGGDRPGGERRVQVNMDICEPFQAFAQAGDEGGYLAFAGRYGGEVILSAQSRLFLVEVHLVARRGRGEGCFHARGTSSGHQYLLFHRRGFHCKFPFLAGCGVDETPYRLVHEQLAEDSPGCSPRSR